MLTVLLRVGPSIDTVSRAQLGSLLLVAFLPLTAYLVPWSRLPRFLQAVPPLIGIPLYLVTVLGSSETSLPYSPVLLLPLLFLGLYYTALELGIGIVLMVVVTVLPSMVSHAGLGDRLLAVVYATVTAVAAISVYLVMQSLRRHDMSVTSLAGLLRDAATARDPGAARSAVCRAAAAAGGAGQVLLAEISDGRLRVTSSWPPLPGADDPGAARARPQSAVGPEHPAVRALAAAEPLLVHRPALDIDGLVGRCESALWLPLARSDRPPGLLLATWDWKLRGTGSQEVAAIRLLAPEASLVIAHADAMEQLEHSALSDPLTGLANRIVWNRDLPLMLARVERAGDPMCVMALDLDHFKAFNDDWGHQMGDDLLRTVSASWSTAIREVDLLARFGGDEFGIALPGCTLPAIDVVVERLRSVLQEGQTYSAGVAWWDGKESAAELLARADALLYECKRSGRGRVLTSTMQASATSLTDWVSLIPRMVKEQDLVSVYQPISRLQDGVVIGYEALARPGGATADVSVDAMFAAAQRMGALRDLDWLARRVALAGARELAEPALLFVNVGARALMDPVHNVDQMLLLSQWAGRSPSTIVLEISEREVINDLRRLSSVLESYRREGFRFAMDDVGEGHLTLELLGAAAPEYVKIARSLTIEAAQGSQRGLVRALVEFALSDGAHVIAEGLETQGQLEAMRSLGVDMGQGYLVGRPARLAGAKAAATAPSRDRGDRSAPAEPALRPAGGLVGDSSLSAPPT